MGPTSTPDKDYYKRLGQLLAEAKDDAQLFKTVVDAPFSDPLQAAQLDLGVVVLLLVNKQTKVIDRIALSDTYSAKGAVRMSVKPFTDIKIPVGFKGNIIARAITTGKPQQTYDWRELFIPALTPEQARLNQAGAGIECSVVYPLPGVRDGGAMIFSFYQPLPAISEAHRDFMQIYSQMVANKVVLLDANA